MLASRGSRRLAPLTIAVAVASVASIPALAERHVSEYKGISYALATSDVSGARVVAERPGPLGLLQVIDSSVERSAPGLSSSTPEELVPPIEMGLYSDGGKLGPLSRDPGADRAAYMDWLVTAAPYAARPARSVAVLGVGGGGAIREALHHGASRVQGVELNPSVLGLLREFSAYDGALLDRPEVATVVADGRAWAETTGDRFDLVVLNVLDVSGLSFSWSQPVGEDYLHTVEAFESYLRILSPGGLVAVPVRLNEPPRGDLKALATAIAAVSAAGPAPVRDAVAFVRETFFGVALMKPDGFAADEVARLRAFCSDKGFDLSWLAGLDPSETNRFTELPDEAYFRLASAAAADAGGLDRFVESYPFDVEPTHDDRPYFGSLFRAVTPGWYRENAQEPERWWREIPIDLWFSYPLLLAILVQATIFGAAILIVPLALARKTLRAARGKGVVAAYFACLGAGYMCAEMVFIQRLTLLLSNPLSSAAVVLSGMLVLSGLGAGASERLASRPGATLRVAFVVIFANVLLLAVLPLSWMRPLIAMPFAGRVIAALALIGPASFCLGFFFPLGIRAVARRNGALVAWAFGINGATSVPAVVAASLATLRFGFTAVLVAVAAVYLLALVFHPRLERGSG
jgi:SAM-dependent methyltransferase